MGVMVHADRRGNQMKDAVIHYTGEQAVETGVTAKVTVNGKRFYGACRAKSGKNGFVEALKWPIGSKNFERHMAEKGELPLKKTYGNVKIKFKV